MASGFVFAECTCVFLQHDTSHFDLQIPFSFLSSNERKQIVVKTIIFLISFVLNVIIFN